MTLIENYLKGGFFMMFIKRRKLLTSSVVLMLALSLLTGCGGYKSTNSNSDIHDESLASDNFKYPIEGDIKLSYFTRPTSADGKSFSELPWGEELEKRTGVKIKYIHPVNGREKEQFNLLLAANELPDLVRMSWLEFPGGPSKAINDNHIYDLSEIIDKYCPNYKTQLENDPLLDKHLKTDEGEYYGFPMIRTDPSLRVYKGHMIRKDWLDELGLDIPETIDDWYVVLKAFKEKKGATAPFTDFSGGTFKDGTFSSGFGVLNTFYIDNGKVVYGPIEPEYKDYLVTMSSWYKEGLLDPDITTVTRNLAKTQILNGESGAIYGFLAGDMGPLITDFNKLNNGGKLVAAPYPSVKKGEKPKFGHLENIASDYETVAISKNCKNVAVAARYMDYVYTEEGRMFYNFGIEGESYEMKDGYPTYVLNDNNEFMTSTHTMINLPGMHDKRAYEQTLIYDEQVEAFETWAKTDMLSHKLPSIMPLAEEAADYSSNMNDINTYVSEMQLGFLLGNIDIETEFDNYVQQVKSLGIDDVLNILQNAYERYQNR